MNSKKPAGGSNIPYSDDMDPNNAISQQLRAIYQEIESEAIPDRFLDLLEKLDAAEASQKGGADK